MSKFYSIPKPIENTFDIKSMEDWYLACNPEQEKCKKCNRTKVCENYKDYIEFWRGKK